MEYRFDVRGRRRSMLWMRIHCCCVSMTPSPVQAHSYEHLDLLALGVCREPTMVPEVKASSTGTLVHQRKPTIWGLRIYTRCSVSSRPLFHVMMPPPPSSYGAYLLYVVVAFLAGKRWAALSESRFAWLLTHRACESSPLPSQAFA